MKIKRFIVSNEDSNCYVISKEHKAIIIDMGEYHSKIIKYLKSEELELLAILSTHGHYDHIDGIYDMVQKNKIDIYLNHQDNIFLKHKIITKDLRNGVINIGDFEIKCIEASGHSAGGIIFQIEDKLFTGDVIFHDGVGRYDLINSSKSDTRKTIDELMLMDDSFIVYPGHEESATLGTYKVENDNFIKI